jgi:hypothetical protein
MVRSPFRAVSTGAQQLRSLLHEVWYHGYHISWTQHRGTGGLPWVGSLGLGARARRPITKAVYKMIVDKSC